MPKGIFTPEPKAGGTSGHPLWEGEHRVITADCMWDASLTRLASEVDKIFSITHMVVFAGKLNFRERSFGILKMNGRPF